MLYPIRVEPTNIHLSLTEDDNGQPMDMTLCFVVPGSVAPEVAEMYRHGAFENSPFQTVEMGFASQWGVESGTKRIHLFVGIDTPAVKLDLVMPATRQFQGLLEKAYRRPAGVTISVFLYDSSADVERARQALATEDVPLFYSLGVGVGQDLDMRPLALVFGV